MEIFFSLAIRTALSMEVLPIPRAGKLMIRFQRFFIVRIHDHPQIGNKIFDFFTLIKTDASVNRIGNSHPPQAFFKSTAL